MHIYSSHLSKDSYAIFLFHGVIKEDNYEFRNSTRKHLQEDYFRAVLEDLKNHGNPITMDEVILINNLTIPMPENAFAITFDDGFENNYSIAVPILRELKIPATFYITTDFVNRNQMSWIDRIEYCLAYSKEVFFPENRKAFLDGYRIIGKQRGCNLKEEFVSECFKINNMKEIWSSDDPLDKKMNWKQVQELSEDFIIGGHTHTHRILTHISAGWVDMEIAMSKIHLKEVTYKNIIHYSYPEGQEDHYNEEVIEQLKEAGIVCCPTAIHGVNKPEDDLFHLKRIMVT